MDVSSPEVWRWIFLAAAVAFAVGEIAAAGTFFFLPFAAGAAVGALAAFAGAPIWAAGAGFLVVSAAASAFLWPLGRRLDRSAPQAAVGATRWAGREAYVVETIPAGVGGTGLVRLDREEWRAQSIIGAAIPAGSTVLVSRVDGTRLMVLPLEEPLEIPALPDADPA